MTMRFSVAWPSGPCARRRVRSRLVSAAALLCRAGVMGPYLAAYPGGDDPIQQAAHVIAKAVDAAVQACDSAGDAALGWWLSSLRRDLLIFGLDDLDVEALVHLVVLRVPVHAGATGRVQLATLRARGSLRVIARSVCRLGARSRRDQCRLVSEAADFLVAYRSRAAEFEALVLRVARSGAPESLVEA